MVRDSGGIQIVEHSAEFIAALPVWGVDGEPVLELGGGDHSAEEFTSIRGAIRFADGRVLIAEGGSNELRLFGPDGAYLATWARRGQGPGEFSSVSSPMLHDGDTVFVMDLSARRTARFGPDGSFLGQFQHPQPPDPAGYVNLIRPWHDGRLLMEHRRRVPAPSSATGPISRDSFAIGWMAAGASRVDTLAIVPAYEWFPGEFSEGGPSFLSYGDVTFGKDTRLGHDGRRLFIGTNATNEIRLYEGGALRRVMRDATPAEPVTTEHQAQYLREREASFQRNNVSEQVRDIWRANLERNTRFAAVFPFHDRLMIGDDGSLWVEMVRRYEDEGRRFVVYDTAGRAMARAEFPERVRPLQVGPDYLVGMWRDPDDVPHLRVWRVGRH
ncbi:MAG: 6-bladed beta-propeller [Gemmatimonadales bacterium]